MAGMQKTKEIDRAAKKSIARGAVTVMLAFIISNIIGLIAKTMTARYYGTSVESSAFFAANRFSEILFNLVAGGALGSAFIPVFTGLLVKGEPGKAWKLASSIINIVTLVLILLSILTITSSETVVQYILAPGFDGPQTALTARLLRIQVLSSVIFGVSGLLMAILNSHQHFLLPAIAPAMYQLGWIFGIIVLSPSMGINGIAWGVVIGAAMHLIVQLPLMSRLDGRSYTFTLGLWMKEVREVARLMAPRLLGVAIIQLNFLLNTLLASFQQEGAITAISLAFPLMIMPEAAIAQSIAIAALPTFSALVAQGKIDEMRQTLVSTLRALLLLAIPASVGLVMLREPIVRVLYGGQAFGQDSVRLVSWALLWYAVGLVGHSLVEVTSRVFYALHDTKTPVFIGVAAMLANLGLSFVFTDLFARLNWMPHGGLALANSLATAVESVFLIIIMRKRMNGIFGKNILKATYIALAASTVMGVVIWITRALLVSWSIVFSTAVSIFVGMGVYIVVLRLTGTDEVSSLLRMIRSKISLIKNTKKE